MVSVVVEFGSGVPSEIQGSALLELEKNLRKSGLDIRVFKRRMGDDSKLRVMMTPAQREAL